MEAIILHSSDTATKAHNGTPEKYSSTAPITPASSEPDASGKTELHTAVINDDPNKVEELLREGSSPTIKDEWGYNILHTAAKKGNPAILRLLLDHAAAKELINDEVEGINGEKITPLFCALFEGPQSTPGKIASIRMLLWEGAKVTNDLLSYISAADYNTPTDSRNMIVRAYHLAKNLKDYTYSHICSKLWQEGKEKLSPREISDLTNYDDRSQGGRSPQDHRLLKTFSHDFREVLQSVDTRPQPTSRSPESSNRTVLIR